MAIAHFVDNLQPSGVPTLSSVTTSTTAGTYTQLPNVPCNELELYVPNAGVAITVGLSATPGNNVLTGVVGTPLRVRGLTNANQLFATNVSGTSAQNIGLAAYSYTSF